LKKGLILLFVLLFPSVLYVVLTTGKHHFIHLPYLGPKELATKTVDGKQITDTIYHVIPPFKFVNQDGRIISDKDFENKIFVANFFFTTCKSICPKMNSQLLVVQEKCKDIPNLLFISHTVNPKRDTVEALAEYAKTIHADTKNWYFVTGDKKSIYDIAANGYFIATAEDASAEGGFIHSEMLTLIDKEKRIRGYYDGTNTTDINKLIDDIKVLTAEYETHNKERGKITVGHE
jgi:protein SCO1/2